MRKPWLCEMTKKDVAVCPCGVCTLARKIAKSAANDVLLAMGMTQAEIDAPLTEEFHSDRLPASEVTPLAVYPRVSVIGEDVVEFERRLRG
jgi:hypothetical protein